MTYSIIPPILVVLSLIGIILFLMKKAPQVAQLWDDVERRGSEVFKKETVAPRAESGTGLKHRSLTLLEKITRRLKWIFVGLENKFATWNESIRHKRRVHLGNKNTPSETQTAVDDFVKKFEEGSPHQEVIQAKRSDKIGGISEEKIYRPMISDKVTSPQNNRVEIKDRLEKLLIERIAANPKDTEAYERLGEYYFEIKNYSHAKECFKQVIRLNPGNEEVKARMRKLERLLAR